MRADGAAARRVADDTVRLMIQLALRTPVGRELEAQQALTTGMKPCVPVKRERAAEDRRAHIEGEKKREKKRRVAAASAGMPAQVV